MGKKTGSLSPNTHPKEAMPLGPDRYAALMDGRVLPSDLTMEELTRGKLMDVNGKFSGAQPRMLPSAFHNILTRELQKRMNDSFKKYAVDAIETIADVMERGEGASAFQGQKDGTGRFIAAKYVVERIIGKIPDKLEVTAEVTAWEGMRDSGELIVDVADDYVEAEVIDDKPEPKKRGPRTRPAPRTSKEIGQ